MQLLLLWPFTLWTSTLSAFCKAFSMNSKVAAATVSLLSRMICMRGEAYLVVLVEPVVGLVEDPDGLPMVWYLPPRTVNYVRDLVGPNELQVLPQTLSPAQPSRRR